MQRVCCAQALLLWEWLAQRVISFWQVAGVTGKVQVDGGDDEGISTEEQGAAILAAFGAVRRNEVIADRSEELRAMHVFAAVQHCFQMSPLEPACIL